MTEEGIADAQMGQDGAAEKTGQQDGAGDRGTGNEIYEQAGQLEDPDAAGEIRGNAEAGTPAMRFASGETLSQTSRRPAVATPGKSLPRPSKSVITCRCK